MIVQDLIDNPVFEVDCHPSCGNRTIKYAGEGYYSQIEINRTDEAGEPFDADALEKVYVFDAAFGEQPDIPTYSRISVKSWQSLEKASQKMAKAKEQGTR